MKKSYLGSCHCGAVRFRAELDLAETSRCNCSVCFKSRFWKAVVPAAAFEVVQGEDSLGDYTFGQRSIHHHFCRTCGVKTFGRGERPTLGKFVGVNIACLDDVSEEELAAAKVEYQDGKHDDWERAPDETRHL